jgi:hypothetical protein
MSNTIIKSILVTILIINAKASLVTIPSGTADELPLITFTKGFCEGIEIFSNLPDLHKCIKGDDKIVHDFFDIVAILQNLNVHSDIMEAFQKIVVKGEDMIQRLLDITGPCLALTDEIKYEITNVASYIMTYEFLTLTPVHIGYNLQKIKTKAMAVKQLYNTKDYFKFGKTIGNFIHYTVLFFYDSVEQNRFLPK